MNPAIGRRVALAVRQQIAYLPILISLEVALLCLVWVLGQEVRGLENAGLSLYATLGLLIGWKLARTGLSGLEAALITSGSGLGLLLFRIGHLAQPFISLINNLLYSGLRGLQASKADLPSLSLIQEPLLQLWKGLSIPPTRFFRWGELWVSGQPAFDPVAVLLLWSMMTWGVAAWAGWAVCRRSQSLLALLPIGALITLLLSYSRAGVLPLVFFLPSVLFLVAYTHFQGHFRRWVENGIDYVEDVIAETGLVVAGLILVITIVAVQASSFSPRQLFDFFNTITVAANVNPGNMPGSLGMRPRPATPFPFAGLRSPGLPRSMLLGAGPEINKQTVMAIEVEGLPTTSGADGTTHAPQFYWRSMTYDRYTGRGWTTSSIETESFPSGVDIISQVYPGESLLHQNVRQFFPPGENSNWVLYSAGTVMDVDEETQVARRSSGDLFGAMVASSTYRATSVVNHPSESQLRAASDSSPVWIRKRYLALPENIPARVLGLGRDLTAAAPTNYDRVLAIETYLRRFPYSLEVPMPPMDREASDYFLFDLKRGYCDYYATTMVVLARAAGVPSRLVTGYASGQFESSTNRYIVTAADAHSWVEIYFEGYGWIEFEPTARLPVIQHQTIVPDPGELSTANQSPSGSIFPEIKPQWELWTRFLGGLIVILVLGFMSWLGWDALRLQILSPAKTLSSLYLRLHRFGPRLAVPAKSAHTPYEFSALLNEQITCVFRDMWISQSFMLARDEVSSLTYLYNLSLYSPRPLKLVEKSQAIRIWSKLRWKLWFAAIYRLLSLINHSKV